MHPLTEVTVTTKRPSLIFAVGDYKPGSLFHASFFWGGTCVDHHVFLQKSIPGAISFELPLQRRDQTMHFFCEHGHFRVNFPLSYMVWELVSYHEPL